MPKGANGQLDDHIVMTGRDLASLKQKADNAQTIEYKIGEILMN